MTPGACLCGAVTWEAAGPLDLMSHCHCSRCRKAHGAAFATYVAAPREGFRWTGGAEHVVRFASSPGFERPFCGRCGSAVPQDAESDDRVVMPAGNLAGDPGTRPVAHIFAASCPAWSVIADTLPRFDAYPPGYGGDELPSPAPAPPPEGRAGGSCLCGGVVYEVSLPVELMLHCHCSRCRRARSAAWATNLVTRAGAVRFVQGEQQLRRFEPSDAERFANVFCTTCGSSLPGVERGSDLAVVPAGTLDHDPGVRPLLHMYVASAAPWATLEDGLPRFDTEPPSVAPPAVH